MSDRHSSRHSHKLRRHIEDNTKPRKTSSSYNLKNYDSGVKTPPLPTKHLKMKELLIKKHLLQQQLKKLEKSSENDAKKENTLRELKKMKSSFSKENSFVKDSKTNNKKCYRKEVKHTDKDFSPDHKDNYLDSEDEENIIEQRRKRRKQLIEKLSSSLSQEQSDSKSTEKADNEDQETKIHNQDSIYKKSINMETTDNAVSDMFSEKDDFVHKDISSTAKDESNSQLIDNWDDPEGYYNIRSGDVVNKKYIIKDILGQGVFANVVRAQDTSNSNAHVAIKIVRNNDLMYKTSLKEITILKQINEADPENKYHCVKYIGHFMHKGHLCLVLESLHMDLRAVLKKYGKHHGIHMKALMSYSRQLLIAVRLLKKIGIVHADIKPDNILVNEKKNVLKLCDFGSAAKLDENKPTPYLVSRFYRAPEIILGIPYNHGIDIWSTACTIYEMATGKILFTGGSNNRMLKCFMDLKGKIPSKMIKKGIFKDQHFNYNNNFLMHKKDEFTGRDKVIEMCNTNVVRDIQKELLKSFKNLTPDEDKKLVQLKDLLEKMLMLEPNQRYSVSDCLRHSFIQDTLIKSK